MTNLLFCLHGIWSIRKLLTMYQYRPAITQVLWSCQFPRRSKAVLMIYTKHNSDWILEQEHVSITIFTGAEMPRQSFSFFCSSDTVYSSLSLKNNFCRQFVYCIILWIKTKVYYRLHRFISPAIIFTAYCLSLLLLAYNPCIECWHKLRLLYLLYNLQ